MESENNYPTAVAQPVKYLVMDEGWGEFVDGPHEIRVEIIFASDI